MKNTLWVRKLFLVVASLIITIILFYHVEAQAKRSLHKQNQEKRSLHKQTHNSRFYDFSDLLIDGEIKKPSTLWIDSRARAKFGKLLLLKKSFRDALIMSAKDPLLK